MNIRKSSVMGARERAERIIDLAIRLVELLRVENRALEDRRYQALSDTLSEKTVLLNNYDVHMNYVNKNKDFVLSLDVELLGDMLEATRLLQEETQTNKRLLENAIAAGEMVLDIIVQAARRHHTDVAGYNAKGRSNTKTHHGTPVTLDRRL